MTAASVFTQLHSKRYNYPDAAARTIRSLAKATLDWTAPNHTANDERGIDSEAKGVRGVERK